MTTPDPEPTQEVTVLRDAPLTDEQERELQAILQAILSDQEDEQVTP